VEIPFKESRPKLDETVFVAPGAKIIGDVTMAEDSSVWYNAVLRGDINGIIIGKGSNIQDLACLHVEDEVGVVIGENCVVGHSAVIHAAHIEDGVLVGIGSTLLNKCHIGSESVIAAGALVSPGKIIPPRSMVVGVPGKIVRQVTDQEIVDIKNLAKKYKNLAKHVKLQITG
jgi:carbonic anhydrase/acetyltransferase-like protein (isoleucine patch superfamily)